MRWRWSPPRKTQADGEMIYSASIVLPMDGPPIPNGQLLVRSGVIEAVGANLSKSHPNEPLKDLGDAILMPGFVNAHTHLDFSALKGTADGKPFAEWLSSMTAFILGRRREDFYWSGMLGAAEMVRAGTTCVGDSTPVGDSATVISDVGLRGVVYRETFDHADKLDRLGDCIAELQAKVSNNVRIGVSPHTIYTQSPEVIRLSAQLAAERGLPVMIHLAETREESVFCGQCRTPAVYLAEMGVLSSDWLLAHCVHCDNDDLAIFAQSGAAVAHCPRSNALLGAGIAPLSRLLQAGITVGLGTDSAASNFDLDLLSEARFALAIHRGASEDASSITAETVLQMATIGGARALGLEQVGCLAPGWAADFIAIRVGDESAPMCYNPYSKLIFGGGTEVVLSVVAGREIMSEGQLLSLDEAASEQVES